jgi:hypothetical protein
MISAFPGGIHDPSAGEEATMVGDDDSLDREVVLGFDAARGFAPADQTSPALAAAGGALLDATLDGEPVTELRIHGVSGSDGPTMLEHPTALQVAGDSVTGFYRRWTPDGPGNASVRWKLEAYSWGGLTEAPLASASWLLLAPFMMYNVAYFMLPPQQRRAGEPGRPGDGRRNDGADKGSGPSVPHLSRDTGHRIGQVLLRLLALAATVQLVSAITVVTVSMAAWEAAGRPGLLPGWMGWYGDWSVGWRAAAALLAVAAAVAVLWLISVKTANRYESRTSGVEPELVGVWPLTQQGFWKGWVLVSRQRALHAAAACAAAALIVAYPAGHPSPAKWGALGFASAVLAAAAGLTASPVADRHAVTLVRGGQPDSRAGTWCDAVLVAGVVAVVASALAAGLTDRRGGPQPGALPGLTGFLLVLLAVQLALLIAFGCIVTVLAVRAAQVKPVPGFEPYLRGGLAALIAALGFALGGLLTAIVTFGVARLLGTPEPSGFTGGPANAVHVPWPIYAFGAGLAGALAGGLLAAVVLYLRYRWNWQRFDEPAGRGSPVAAAYQGGLGSAFDTHRRAIAKAWAVGLLADDAAMAVALTLGCAMAFVVAFEFLGLLNAGTASAAGWWSGLAAVISLSGLLVVAGFVALLRDAYSNTADRKTIGALWDVATFWPRAVHPFAPPCYGERAVPEVVDRIRVLTGQPPEAGQPYPPEPPGRPPASKVSVRPGPVLLTGYSQGSIIAPAVAAQLPPEVRDQVALLTLACPARRLYGRAFPAYFGMDQLSALSGLLGGTGPAGRWKNLVRRSDFIGSWAFNCPEPRFDNDYLRNHVDQPCLDPVTLVPDANPTPPPTHRHSGWWPDPRTGVLGRHLVDLLADHAHDPPPGQRPAASAEPGAQPPIMPAAWRDPGKGQAPDPE